METLLKEAQRLKDKFMDERDWDKAGEIRDLLSEVERGERATVKLLGLVKKNGVEVH